MKNNSELLIFWWGFLMLGLVTRLVEGLFCIFILKSRSVYKKQSTSLQSYGAAKMAEWYDTLRANQLGRVKESHYINFITFYNFDFSTVHKIQSSTEPVA